MIYENKERVDSICEEIEKHMGKLNGLCKAQIIRIENAHGYGLLTIAVEPDSPDEYGYAGMVMINFIKEDLKRKITDLHTDLEKL